MSPCYGDHKVMTSAQSKYVEYKVDEKATFKLQATHQLSKVQQHLSLHASPAVTMCRGAKGQPSAPLNRSHLDCHTMDSNAFTAPFQFTKTLRHDIYEAIDAKNPGLSAAGKTILATGATGGIGGVRIADQWLIIYTNILHGKSHGPGPQQAPKVSHSSAATKSLSKNPLKPSSLSILQPRSSLSPSTSSQAPVSHPCSRRSLKLSVPLTSLSTQLEPWPADP
jgi:hypothetical protein